MEKGKKNIVAHFVSMRRVSRVRAAGKTSRSSVCVVVGDESGSVGVALGKSAEVAEAVKKATRAAMKKMKKINLFQGRTVPYDVKGSFCRSLACIKRAKPGTGIVAGGAARYVFEALGVKDAVCKVIGNNPINNVKAVICALLSLRRPTDIALMRGIDKARLFYKKEGRI